MNSLFKPKGEKSQAQIILEAIQDIDRGHLLTYQRLTELTGFSKEIILSNIQTVNRRLLRSRKKCLANVRKVGYVLVEPKEHERLANNRKKKATRQISRGVEILKNTDLTALTPDEKARHSFFLNHMSHNLSILRSKGEKSISHTRKSLRLQEEAREQLLNLEADVKALKKKYGIED